MGPAHGIVLCCTLGLVAGLVLGEDISKPERPSEVKLKMRLVEEPVNTLDVDDYGLANTDLILAFVMFRHGDRTPDIEEMELYPAEGKNKEIFFPYGLKALTNEGKRRSYSVGKYLRDRYDGLISRLYLPEESVTRTTDYARTKMTALTALAALFAPPPAQQWNPALDWQPVPYNTLPYDDDDLLYWYNCPRYLWVRNHVYALPAVKKLFKPYTGLCEYLSQKTGTNITTPEDVFFLDNLFQTMENVGVSPPKWALNVMPEIKAITKIEYAVQFLNTELIRLSTGVLLSEIVNASTEAIRDRAQPKLRLYSAHENNVAALMAAARVFQPHQPGYGATFSLELRRRPATGQYGFTAVYSPDAGGSVQILPISGCGGESFCDFETFLQLSQDYMMTNEDFRKQCTQTF